MNRMMNDADDQPDNRVPRPDDGPPTRQDVVVIGAGIGGLSAALALAGHGVGVTVLERHGWVGGKMRVTASPAGPVDAGPTVLTLRRVFDDLFRRAGLCLDDHVTLIREPCLARHFWPDGAHLDLFDDRDQNAAEIERFAGGQARRDFLAFDAEARALFHRFDEPMMQAARPSLPALAAAAATAPRCWPALAPWARLSRHLRRRFDDPRLAQLFARYATYVGGLPHHAPALLALIWQAEAAGVWRVAGGMHRLAEAIAAQIIALGGTIHLNCGVEQIERRGMGGFALRLDDDSRIETRNIIFNGDPRSLSMGLLGSDTTSAAPGLANRPRSLSARVWSFSAKASGPDLAHHNVFFADDPLSEFKAIEAGQMPDNPTLYLCAQDRGHGMPPPQSAERFEVILNAAPLTTAQSSDREAEQCQQITLHHFERHGVGFTPAPDPAHLTTPAMFEHLFPGSAGALYGQSPHGALSALTRPKAQTKLPGLYLAGGATHPGPGVPMAAQSGINAAAAILAKRNG